MDDPPAELAAMSWALVAVLPEPRIPLVEIPFRIVFGDFSLGAVDLEWSF